MTIRELKFKKGDLVSCKRNEYILFGESPTSKDSWFLGIILEVRDNGLRKVAPLDKEYTNKLKRHFGRPALFYSIDEMSEPKRNKGK